MIKQTVITPRPQTVKKRRPRGAAGWPRMRYRF